MVLASKMKVEAVHPKTATHDSALEVEVMGHAPPSTERAQRYLQLPPFLVHMAEDVDFVTLRVKFVHLSVILVSTRASLSMDVMVN
jgi:hypothetical protein